MLKGGLLPSPVIVPLSSNSLALKNKIHTQTFVELRSGWNSCFCFDEICRFVWFRCTKCSNLFYCRWFETRCVSKQSINEFISRCFSTRTWQTNCQSNCCDKVIHFLSVSLSSFANTSFDISNGSRESNVITKYFDVNDIYTDEYIDEDQNSNNEILPDFDRTAWNEAFNPDGSTQDWIEIPYECTREPIVQPVRQTEISHEDERFWERKCKPLSPGNGNWKRTMEHVFLNFYQFVKNEPQLRELFGWKIFGRVNIYI